MHESFRIWLYIHIIKHIFYILKMNFFRIFFEISAKSKYFKIELVSYNISLQSRY